MSTRITDGTGGMLFGNANQNILISRPTGGSRITYANQYVDRVFLPRELVLHINIDLTSIL